MAAFHRHVHLDVSIRPTTFSIGALGLCAYSLYCLKQKGGTPDPQVHVAPSPLKTVLPRLSDEEIENLPYPPGVLPGSRDVQTPYGSIRVYEWGPEDGRKVLLLCGISSPCLMLGPLAACLVKKGCRVMLFDLFGRGYTDNPSDLKHDARLYTTQILLSIASSPLPWTGMNAFSILGYSCGGGIAASFKDTFPLLVRSLILIAPSGIIRLSHTAWSSKFLYHTQGYLPESLVRYLVRRRLRSSYTCASPSETRNPDTAEAVAAAETSTVEVAKESAVATLPSKTLADVSASVLWQITHHVGFIPAFISAIRFAPITGQHASWRRIGKRLEAQRQTSAKPDSEGARSTSTASVKVLLLLGESDSIVIPSEVGPDAAACFGEENLETVIIRGDHDIPATHAEDVVEAIVRHWEDAVGSPAASSPVEV